METTGKENGNNCLGCRAQEFENTTESTIYSRILT